MTPTELTRAVKALAKRANNANYAIAQLARKCQRDNVPHWYEIIAREYALSTRWAFSIARTWAFCEVVFTNSKLTRHSLKFSHYEKAAAYWQRENVSLETLIEVLDEAVHECVSVDALDEKLREVFGLPDEPADYGKRWGRMGKQLWSDAESIGQSHPRYAAIVQAAQLLEGKQR